MRERFVMLKPFLMWKTSVFYSSACYRKISYSFTNSVYSGSGHSLAVITEIRLQLHWGAMDRSGNAHEYIQKCIHTDTYAQIKLCFAYSHDKNYLYGPDAPKDLENPSPTELVTWHKRNPTDTVYSNM